VTASLQLLLTLTSVTLLFAIAQSNGTMAAAVAHALRLCRGRAPLLPPMFFLLAAASAMIGPGAILATALIAPFAMSAGTAAGLPPFLIALMVCNGANAGNLSPFSTTGVIVSGLMTRAGLGGHEFRVWFFHAAAHVAAAAVAYALCGGLASWRSSGVKSAPKPPPLAGPQTLTVAVIAAWIAAVIALKLPLGWTALGAAAILLVLGAATLHDAVTRMPWKVIALVVTISAAVGYIERAGGLDWFKIALTRLATPQTAHAAVAFLTGLISSYSSTSAVALPAFLPLAPGIAASFPGVDALAMSITIAIGSALVDVSPLSTLGALCIAALPPKYSARDLFTKLMIWGFSMSVAGAALCYFASPLFSESTPVR
jgi:hypothetical protein